MATNKPDVADQTGEGQTATRRRVIRGAGAAVVGVGTLSTTASADSSPIDERGYDIDREKGVGRIAFENDSNKTFFSVRVRVEWFEPEGTTTNGASMGYNQAKTYFVRPGEVAEVAVEMPPGATDLDPSFSVSWGF